MMQGAKQRLAGKPAVVLVIVSLGLVLSNLDLFVVNVALPSIASYLHPGDLGELSWILNAYAIVFAALLVPAGRYSDRSSRKAGFLIGVAVFVAASGACAAATSVPTLITFRVVQAIGAAMLLSTSLGLVLGAYPPERRFGAVDGHRRLRRLRRRTGLVGRGDDRAHASASAAARQ
jgi:MFS family permease